MELLAGIVLFTMLISVLETRLVWEAKVLSEKYKSLCRPERLMEDSGKL